MLSRNRKAAQRRGWSHGGEPLSLTTWPGCARRPPFRQRTSPETETRKAEPANKSLIDRRLSALSPALCSQLQLRDADPLSVGTLVTVSSLDFGHKSKGTLAGTRGNEPDAPIAAVERKGANPD